MKSDDYISNNHRSIIKLYIVVEDLLKILYSFLSFSIFIPANASEFERDLTYMDYQDILQVAKLCDVAYDQTENKFKSQLEEKGWDINFLPLKELPKPVGLKAHKGPLTVVAYAGNFLCPLT